MSVNLDVWYDHKNLHILSHPPVRTCYKEKPKQSLFEHCVNSLTPTQLVWGARRGNLKNISVLVLSSMSKLQTGDESNLYAIMISFH